jgi:hypothetical protein
MIEGSGWRARLNDARRLLEGDRKLLLAGKISALAAKDARRLEIESKLVSMPRKIVEAEQAIIQEIQALAKRNNRLLKAYLDGARAAMRRLQEIERVRGQIGAYHKDGSRVDPVELTSTRQVRA